jgi:hypothetical protein
VFNVRERTQKPHRRNSTAGIGFGADGNAPTAGIGFDADGNAEGLGGTAGSGCSAAALECSDSAQNFPAIAHLATLPIQRQSVEARRYYRLGKSLSLM